MKNKQLIIWLALVALISCFIFFLRTPLVNKYNELVCVRNLKDNLEKATDMMEKYIEQKYHGTVVMGGLGKVIKEGSILLPSMRRRRKKIVFTMEKLSWR